MDIKEIALVNGMRQLFIPHLNSISSYLPEGARNWLELSGNFIPNSNSKKDYFEITLYDIDEFIRAWAGDIVRLSSAAFETVGGITESVKNKKFLAWQMIQYYYAAFFAAHSTLKICSFGLIQINDRIIKNIFKRADSLSISLANNIIKGIYCAKIDIATSKVIFYKVNKYDDSHRGLWHRYGDFLDVLNGISVVTGQFDSSCVRHREMSEEYPLSIYSQLPLEDAEPISKRISTIKETINAHGDNNWLSFVRNRINYNHHYGIWFPYKLFKDEYDSLISKHNLHLDNPLSKKLEYEHEFDLNEFVKCCQTIIAINRDILFDLSYRHPSNKSFLNNGPLELLNLQY